MYENENMDQSMNYYKDGINEALVQLTKGMRDVGRNNEPVKNLTGKLIVVQALDNVNLGDIIFFKTMANRLNLYMTATIKDESGRNLIMYDIKRREIDAHYTVRRLSEMEIDASIIKVTEDDKFFYSPILSTQIVQEVSSSLENMPSKVVVLEKKIYIPVIEEKEVIKEVIKEVVKIVKIEVPTIIEKKVYIPVEQKIYIDQEGSIIQKPLGMNGPSITPKSIASSNTAFGNIVQEKKTEEVSSFDKQMSIYLEKDSYPKAKVTQPDAQTKQKQASTIKKIKVKKIESLFNVGDKEERKEEILYIVNKLKREAKFLKNNEFVHKNTLYKKNKIFEGYKITNIYSKREGKYRVTLVSFENDPFKKDHFVASIYINKKDREAPIAEEPKTTISQKNTQAEEVLLSSKKVQKEIEKKARKAMLLMIEDKVDKSKEVKKEVVAKSEPIRGQYQCNFNLIKTAYSSQTKELVKINASHPYYNQSLKINILSDAGKNYLISAGNGLPNLYVSKNYFKPKRKKYCGKIS